MSIKRIDQFEYTCDRCGKKETIEHDSIDVTVFSPPDWIEIVVSPSDSAENMHLCETCKELFIEFFTGNFPVAKAKEEKICTFCRVRHENPCRSLTQSVKYCKENNI